MQECLENMFEEFPMKCGKNYMTCLLEMTAKYWHKASSKYAPVIDFAAGLTTYFQVYFLKNLNHQFPGVLSRLASASAGSSSA